MNKTEIIQKIKQIEGLSNDERAYLVELVNTKKKYGLVWEDKPEDVEEQLRTQLPVLKEVVERRILAKDLLQPEKQTKTKQATLFDNDDNKDNIYNPDNKDYNDNPLPPPNHILIEGDNLHALTALTFTHEGQIDVMYFDPPYNTGNKDFKYNDSYVDKEDSYRHSKWLSFMDKRLRIAKRLLSEKGVIFISIDDYEQATLKLLCDEIFTEMNFVGNIIWQRAYAPINLKKTISQNHDFILIYCKQEFQTLELNKLPRTDKQDKDYKNPDNDPRGLWKVGNPSVGPAVDKNIYEVVLPSGRVVLPPKGRSWLYSRDRLTEKIADNRIWFGKDGNSIWAPKIYLSEVRQGVVAMSLWTYEEVGHTQDGKKELKEVLHENEKPFETVKPLKLIDRIFKLTTDNKKQYKILDIFAGSGTTLHATMKLNAEDGGNRQCILVTNNENNIAEEVCYERNRRVIQGYTNSKGEWVPGLTNNNLRYYKSGFVGREPSLKNKRELTKLATELLCIKEDCYTNVTPKLGDFSWHKLFTNGLGRFVYVLFDDLYVEVAVEALKKFMATQNSAIKMKVFVFANGQYAYAEEFEEIAANITLAALPDAIYKAYQNVLPKQNREFIPVLEDETFVEPQTNFNL